MTFDPTGLPRVAEWLAATSGPALGLVDYVGERVGPTATVAVAGLLWPQFVRVDECILIADRYDPQTFATWRERLGKRGDIEAAVNHVHLWDVFSGVESVPDEALKFLGQVMCKTWAAALAEAFPDEQLDIEFSNDPDDYGPTVTMRSRS